VWRLDRLGRSLKHLIEVVEDLNAKGIGFASLTESIDTTTSNGKLIFHIFCSLAEFERNIIRERTMAGLAALELGGGKVVGSRRSPKEDCDGPTSGRHLDGFHRRYL
jgi:DNA invertase Pin-like site-specific DNA recombinase